MRLSIQEDFTLGGIVSYFDPAKKGYITATDLKQADKQQSLDYLDDEDLHHILTPRKELTSNDPSVAGSAINIESKRYEIDARDRGGADGTALRKAKVDYPRATEFDVRVTRLLH